MTIGYVGSLRNKINMEGGYKEGQTYIYQDDIEIGQKGFHYVTNIIDLYHSCFIFNENFVIFEVEILGRFKTEGYRSVTNKLKIIRILSKREIQIISKNKIEFDKKGNLIRFEDSNGNWSICEFNDNRDFIKHIHSDGRWQSWKYDSKDRWIEYKTFKGDKITNKYNNKDQLVEKKFNDSDYWKYEYDEYGNLTKEIKSHKNEVTNYIFPKV